MTSLWQLKRFEARISLFKSLDCPLALAATGMNQRFTRYPTVINHNLGWCNCRKEVINAPPVPSISRCIHTVYRHKNVWEYQWSNFIYNCMSTFLHYVHCKDALPDCSAPGGERCESLTWVDEIAMVHFQLHEPRIFYPSAHWPETVTNAHVSAHFH